MTVTSLPPTWEPFDESGADVPTASLFSDGDEEENTVDMPQPCGVYRPMGSSASSIKEDPCRPAAAQILLLEERLKRLRAKRAADSSPATAYAVGMGLKGQWRRDRDSAMRIAELDDFLAITTSDLDRPSRSGSGSTQDAERTNNTVDGSLAKSNAVVDSGCRLLEEVHSRSDAYSSAVASGWGNGFLPVIDCERQFCNVQ
jgi:hypothetical protein